jgi:hypothetical protein
MIRTTGTGKECAGSSRVPETLPAGIPSDTESSTIAAGAGGSAAFGIEHPIAAIEQIVIA